MRSSGRLAEKKQATLSDYLKRSKQLSLSPAPAKRALEEQVRAVEPKQLFANKEDEAVEKKVVSKEEQANEEEEQTTDAEDSPPEFDEVPEPKAARLSGDITAKINALRGQVAKAETSLSSWIAKREELRKEGSILEPEVNSPIVVENDLVEPPPLEDPLLPLTPTAKFIPAIQSQHAVLVAKRLGIPLNVIGLALPSAAAFLDSLVGHLDHAIALASSRSQPVVFARLVGNLQGVLKKRILPEHLDQICRLWPDAFQREPCWTICEGRRVQSQRLQVPAETGDAIERRIRFKWAVVERIRIAHEHFIAKELELPAPEFASLKAWHPQFPLEQVDFFPTDNSKEDSLKEPQLPNTPSETSESENKTPEAKAPSNIDSPVKTSLLERIKAKQAAAELFRVTKAASTDAQDSTKTSLCAVIDRLVVLYASNRKNSLSLTFILERLSAIKEEQLRQLAAVLPKWMQIIHADDVLKQGDLIVRIDRTTPTKALKAQIASATLP